MHGSRSLVRSKFEFFFCFFFVGIFGPFSCRFASLVSLFHFLLASTFQQERGLSLCVSTAVHVSCFLFLGTGSPSFQIFSALCFCVVSGAGGSVLSLLVQSV